MTRFGVAVLLLLLVPLTGAAQDRHTVEIRDGAVTVDGRQLKADELPPSLDLTGLTASLSFSGDAVFDLGGLAFTVREGKLVELGKRDDMISVTVTQAPHALFISEQAMEDAPFPQAYELYVEALGNRAVRLDELRAQLAAPQENGAFVIADRMAEEAEQAAAIVRAFPRIELKSYLNDLQDRDQGLYEGIMQEQLMEMESRRLAARIRTTGDGENRSELEKELQTTLRAIFELKQDNRRREIDQLGGRLEELREQMEVREANRDRIIRRRMEQLLHIPHE